DFLVLQNAGPKSGYAMPEAGYLPIPSKLARAGVKDMVRISDARMSGTAYGTIVLHVSPESAVGGPLALVQNGDRIRLSVNDRGRCRQGAALARALDAERVQRRGRLQVVHLERRHVGRARQRVVHQGAGDELAARVVDDLLDQRVADPVGDASVNLSLDHQRI